MSLKIKIAARLKAKAAGVNLSQKRIDSIVSRAEKGLTEDSDDSAIDANLDIIDELSPFKEIAALDDHQRAKDKKIADDKEAARLKAIEEGKTPEPELPGDMPEYMKSFLTAQAAQNKVLQDQIAAITGEKVTNARSAQLDKILENTPDAFKNKAIKDFKRMKFETEEQFTEYLSETETDVADFVQEQSNLGLTGQTPAAGFGKKTGEKEVSPAMKERIAERKAVAEAKTAQTA